MGWFLWIVLAYLLGGVPFGLFIARTFCGVDPREAGSRNTGATNVARLCGTGWGVLSLALDILKGFFPVLVAVVFTDSAALHSLTALAAVLGHVYSPFLGFRGGKAVATTVGVFLPLAFGQLLMAAAMCIVVIAVSGFVSLGSLTLVTAMPLLLLLTGELSLVPLAAGVMVVVYWRHRENIQRLARGEEKPWRRKGADPAAAPAEPESDTPGEPEDADRT
jgi:glycerol-3-phosphate acyltransferase PlsY